MSTPMDLDVENNSHTITEYIGADNSQKTNPDWVIHANGSPYIHIVHALSGVPILNDLSIENAQDFPHENLTLIAHSSADFMKSKQWDIPYIHSHDRYAIMDLELSLDPKFLAIIQTYIEATMTFELRHGDTTLVETRINTTLIPQNVWMGFEHRAEFIRYHIHSQNALTQEILKKCSRIFIETRFSCTF